MRKAKYKIARLTSDLPKVKKNEILIVPQTNMLWEVPPFTNRNNKPDWWKNLQKGKGSLRRCHGTIDYLSLGITFSMWTNIYVRPTPNRKSFEVKLDQISAPEGRAEFRTEWFPYSATEGCPFAKDREIQEGDFPKLVTPWMFKTAPGYSTLILPTLFEQDPNYSVLPGVVHTDYYHTINIVLNIHTDKEFTIPIGTPMYQLIPFKRSDNVSKIIEGNETMWRFVNGRGVGEHYLGNFDRRVSYRRELAKADSLAEKQNKSLIEKILKR